MKVEHRFGKHTEKERRRARISTHVCHNPFAAKEPIQIYRFENESKIVVHFVFIFGVNGTHTRVLRRYANQIVMVAIVCVTISMD